MEYTDIEQVWGQRVAQLTAKYEAEIVAITLNNKQQIDMLNEEIARLRNGAVQEVTDAGTTADPS